MCNNFMQFHGMTCLSMHYSKWTTCDCIHLVSDEEHLSNGDLCGMGEPSLQTRHPKCERDRVKEQTTCGLANSTYLNGNCDLYSCELRPCMYYTESHSCYGHIAMSSSSILYTVIIKLIGNKEDNSFISLASCLDRQCVSISWVAEFYPALLYW